jgi:hypothetical protein
MSRRLWAALLLFAVTTVPAHAQLVVIDPGNLVQTVLIAQRAEQIYEQVQAQYRTIVRLGQSLGSLDRYQIPAIGITAHDPGRWIFGAPWLQGLNTGDARGTAYLATAVPLLHPDDRLSQLTPEARRAFQDQYATVEVSDSVAMLGGHQVALVRDYHNRLQQVVQALEADILNRSSAYHEMTAVLDKISAGELLGRRAEMASDQLLSHALEQLLVRNKRLRDTEAATINMQLVTWRDGQAVNDAFAAGTGDALRTWRQP